MADIKAMADRMISAVRDHVARAVDPLASRVAALEFKAGALVMSMARGDPAKVAQIDDSEDVLQRLSQLEARIVTQEARDAAIQSAERRLSRHAEHLARLEDRTKALEQK